MDWTGTGVKVALDAVKESYKKIKGNLSKRERKQLVTEAMRELLKMEPDIDAVDAALEAAGAIEAEPSRDLYRAKNMRKKVGAYRKKKVAYKKKVVKKEKATIKRKKVARKKATKKK